MVLAPINAGDIVRISKRGREFLAVVTVKADKEVSILPLDDHHKYYSATSHEIISHWKKSKQSKK